MELKWTELAVNDLEGIRDYIAKDSEFYAIRLIERVFQVIEKLKLFPESGRVVQEIDDINIRELILMNYRIIYKIEKDFIYILAIIHGSRNISNIKLNP
jgi:addiction module RelE/StbE family toxin